MLSRRGFLTGVAAAVAASTKAMAYGSSHSVVRVAPTGGEPLAETLRAAIEQARPTDRIKLVFHEGQHVIADTLASTDGPNPGAFAAELVFDGFREVVIEGEGNGAELLFSDFKRGAFRFLHCDRVTVDNIRIDWPRPPFSTGVVTASNGADIEVLIDDDFPMDGRLAVTSVVRYDPNTGATCPVPDGVMYYHVPPENTVFLEPQRLRITFPEERDLPPGAVLSFQHAQYGFDGFHFWHCGKVRLEDTVVHTCPGMAFHGHSCHDLTMRRCGVFPSRRQRRRFHSSTADGSHFVNFSGRVTLDDCTFTNTGDDCNNTWGTFMFVVDRLDDRTLRISHQGVGFMFPQKVEAGDVFEFVGADLATVARIEAEDVQVERKRGAYRVRFAEAVPNAVQKDSFLFDATRLPSLRIRNCRCVNTRGRGFLVTTRDAVVEGCTFDRLQSGGILALPMMEPWFEAAPLDGLTIRRNRFTNCNHGIGPCCGEIMVGAIHNGWTHGAVGVNRNILVAGNTIENTGNLWIHIGSTDGAIVKNNIIVNGNAQNPHVPWMKAAVSLVNSRNLRFEGNRFSWKRDGDERFRFWDIQTGVDTATLDVENNAGFEPPPS